jgi:UDP:flavonoid glycosyltransferase YjiC (YdhE family)
LAPKTTLNLFLKKPNHTSRIACKFEIIDKMKTALIAWELGGGLGHAVRCNQMAWALRRRNVRSCVALRDLSAAHTLVWPESTVVLQAPVSLNTPPGLRDPATYAEILYLSGFHDAGNLRCLLGGWEHLIGLIQPELVLIDHAPIALCAAHEAGLPSVRLGTGFFAPPLLQPLPSFRFWMEADMQRASQIEAKVLANLNAISKRRWNSVAEACHPCIDLISSWPELDHYLDHRGADTHYVGHETAPEAGEHVRWKNPARPRILAYLKPDYARFRFVLNSLRAYPGAVTAFVPGLSATEIVTLETPNLQLLATPLDLVRMLPDCDALLCHAGSGTVSAALCAGKPVLMLPTTAEQHLFAKRVIEQGAGLSLAEDQVLTTFVGSLNRLVSEPGFANHATALAHKHSADKDAIEHAARIIGRVMGTNPHHE